jgi:hypothetical protein
MYAMHSARERSDMPRSDSDRPLTPWQEYVKARLDDSGRRQKEFDGLTSGVITNTMVSNWVTGRSGAEPEAAALFALTTGAPVMTALRAAGHETLADIIGSQMATARDPRIAKMLDDPLLTEADRTDFQEIVARRENRLAVELVALLGEMIKTRQGEASQQA